MKEGVSLWMRKGWKCPACVTDGRAELFWRPTGGSFTAADIYGNLQLVPRTAPLENTGKHLQSLRRCGSVGASLACECFCLAFLVINRGQGGGRRGHNTYWLCHKPPQQQLSLGCNWGWGCGNAPVPPCPRAAAESVASRIVNVGTGWGLGVGRGGSQGRQREWKENKKKLAIKMGTKRNKNHDYMTNRTHGRGSTMTWN